MGSNIELGNGDILSGAGSGLKILNISLYLFPFPFLSGEGVSKFKLEFCLAMKLRMETLVQRGHKQLLGADDILG